MYVCTCLFEARELSKERGSTSLASLVNRSPPLRNSRIKYNLPSVWKAAKGVVVFFLLVSFCFFIGFSMFFIIFLLIHLYILIYEMLLLIFFYSSTSDFYYFHYS